MKTMKFRLLATIVTLAAVITTTNSTNAQRRSTSDSTNNERVENTRTGNKSNIEKKSTFREDAKELKSTYRSVNSNREVNRNNSQASERKNRGSVGNSAHSNHNSDKVITKRSEMSRRSTGYTSYDGKSNTGERYNSDPAITGNKSERYNHNADDIRYKPGREYKGSDKYWSSDFRTDNKRNSHIKGNQNYNNYKHWDRNWENYRWNQNSWRNYYRYYDPYSFKNNKHYYHHNYYGHVIRRFAHKPQIYIHNHTRYYCYDGFFFRYRSGVGYVLTDVPFGMIFEDLPDNYERVLVNGYLYFRVGNLFFERTNYGFLLVHYPERYYAYNDDYRFDG